ncbi:MAG: hypothetical protein ACI396_04130 [Acutalibacteraceae bacterium]
MDIIKEFEYKGKSIRILYYPSEPKYSQYKAEVLNGSDTLFDETACGAEEKIKNRIDNIPTFRELSFRPLEEYEIEAIKSVLIKDNSTIFLRRQLKKYHYITHNGKVYLDPRFLHYHYKELQKLLLDVENYAVNLKSAEYRIDENSCFIVYDADVYKTNNAIQDLLYRIYLKQKEEE